MEKLILDAHEQYRVDLQVKETKLYGCYKLRATNVKRCSGDEFCRRIINWLVRNINESEAKHFRIRPFSICPCSDFTREKLREFVKLHTSLDQDLIKQDQ